MKDGRDNKKNIKSQEDEKTNVDSMTALFCGSSFALLSGGTIVPNFKFVESDENKENDKLL